MRLLKWEESFINNTVCSKNFFLAVFRVHVFNYKITKFRFYARVYVPKFWFTHKN